MAHACPWCSKHARLMDENVCNTCTVSTHKCWLALALTPNDNVHNCAHTVDPCPQGPQRAEPSAAACSVPHHLQPARGPGAVGAAAPAALHHALQAELSERSPYLAAASRMAVYETRKVRA
eukprot:298344-Pelagomonas_calceolata.AAC.4